MPPAAEGSRGDPAPPGAAGAPGDHTGTGAALRFGSDTRLRTRRDFDAVFQGGRKAVNRQLVLWYRPAEGPRARLGLSVSRRIGDAVRRNRVKRCLRAAFRALQDQLPARLDLVIIARPGQPPRDAATAEQALAHLLRRVRRELRGEPAPARGPRRPRDGDAAPTALGDGRAGDRPRPQRPGPPPDGGHPDTPGRPDP